MLTRRLAGRPGFTLAELLLVLVLGCIALGIASTVGVRLQRDLSSESARVAVDEQLAGAAEVLPIDFRALSPSAGDIVAAGARDTSLDVRATIGSAIVCSSVPGTINIAFHRGGGGQIIAPRAAPGDTLWLLVDADQGERWRPAPISALRRADGVCDALDATAEQVVDRSHLWAADIHDSILAQPGAALRITRPERFSIYRASDGQWYVGLRSWNSGLRAYNGVQPIAGPFRSPSSPRGTRLTYFDSAGALITAGSTDTRAIARIEAVLAADVSVPAKAAVESLTVVTALRNRDD